MFEAPETPSKPVSHRYVFILFLIAAAVAVGGWGLEHFAGENRPTPDVAGFWMLPFALLLAGIATMPFIAKHFWEHNYKWVSIGLAVLVTAYYSFGIGTPEHGGPRAMAHSFADFISFICLLGSLFIVSGGILIRVRRKATPLVNVGLLLVGAILANVFGTTGASMLLIRPFLRINKGHIRPYHVVFFIFAVSNLGGALTPVGDPPLFLGYLKGVPFWWVAEHCWQPWAVGVGALLAVFFVFDTVSHGKETRAEHDANDLGPAVSIFGAGNLVYIAMVLAGVFLPAPYRELLMVTAACASLWTTPNRIHRENVFNFAPIKEVALLFVGIFATMVPALNYLSTHANDPAFKKYLQTPGQFYFASGSLSSVLDNAPTYMTFLETELGKIDPKLKEVAREIVLRKGQSAATRADYDKILAASPERYAADPKLFKQDTDNLDAALKALQKYHGDKVDTGNLTKDETEVGFLLGNPELNWYIVAISLGSVFFGAMTYIGNGPNFMVKSIAENAGAQCPSFFGYIFRYSLPILLPILLLVWFIFLYGHGG
jgi:Na+/H+ antiporter NhaD/arsenite permease-like protein